MAKLTKQKARKEYECCKCHKRILKGETYQKIIEMYRAPRTVCESCVVPRSELTNSEYLSWLFDTQDNFTIETYDDVQQLIESMEEQKSELEDRLYNIPEQFQEGEAGCILQERIDNLDDAILQLEQIDFDEFEEEKEKNSDGVIDEKLEEAREILMSLE